MNIYGFSFFSNTLVLNIVSLGLPFWIPQTLSLQNEFLFPISVPLSAPKISFFSASKPSRSSSPVNFGFGTRYFRNLLSLSFFFETRTVHQFAFLYSPYHLFIDSFYLFFFISLFADIDFVVRTRDLSLSFLSVSVFFPP